MSRPGLRGGDSGPIYFSVFCARVRLCVRSHFQPRRVTDLADTSRTRVIREESAVWWSESRSHGLHRAHLQIFIPWHRCNLTDRMLRPANNCLKSSKEHNYNTVSLRIWHFSVSRTYENKKTTATSHLSWFATNHSMNIYTQKHFLSFFWSRLCHEK